MARSAQRQFLIAIAFPGGLTITGYWAKSSGGASSVAFTKHWDGGSTNPEATSSNTNFTDLVISRWYDPTRDQPIEAALRRLIPQALLATITSTPTDGALVPIAAATTWTGKLKEVMGPQADTDSGDAAQLQVTFEVLSAR